MTELHPVTRRPSARIDAPPEEAWALFRRSPVARMAGLDARGRPFLRTLHFVVLDGALCFHASRVGEKLGALRGPVVVGADEPLVTIPSHFFDPVRACPATTYYRSAMAWGRLEEVPDADTKARALSALMDVHQPEGGFAPIRAQDPRYAAAIDKIAVLRVRPDRIRARFKLGQNKPREVIEVVIERLWRRGAPGDLEAIGVIRDAHPDDPRPAFLRGPAGTTFDVAPSAPFVEGAVDLVAGEYWNEGVPRPALRRAHAESTAWIVARDERGVAATARATTDAKRAWIYDVGVRGDARGRGIGRALIALLLDHPRVRGCRDVLLATRDAQPFYARLGFAERPPRHATMALRIG